MMNKFSIATAAVAMVAMPQIAQAQTKEER